MTHLEVENLASDYLEGGLEPSLRTGVEGHLAGCVACRELLANLGRVVELCRAAEVVEPAPWLVSKILIATVGRREPTLAERLARLFQPVVQPRLAYTAAMVVFSISIIVSAAGINLRNLKARDLNPRTWAYRANRTGHLLYARAEKFYYDLRVVYEIESRFRRLRPESEQQEKETPKPEEQPGGTTDLEPRAGPQLASNWSPGSASTRRSPTP